MTIALLLLMKGKFGAAPLIAMTAAASLLSGLAIGAALGAAVKALF